MTILDKIVKDKFKEVVFAFSDENVKKVILDLDKLVHMDSNGIGMLLVLHENAKKSSGTVIIKNLKGNIKILFDKSELNSIFNVE